MLKKISIDQLALGMHVHAVCGSWFDNPFWSNSFNIDSLIDLARLQSGRVRQVWIDTSKGADVRPAAPAPEAEAPSETPETPAAAPEPEPDPAPVAAPAPLPKRVPPTTGTAEELARAARVIAESRRAVADMFADIRMGRMIDADRAAPVVDDIAASVLRNTGALISLVRLKQADDYTYLHSVAVCAMMVALARQLGLDEDDVHRCGMAGLLHDVGKMAVPTTVLNKPGKLTDDEFACVRQHALAGHALLQRSGVTCPVVLDVCLHHHERVDGGGYPHGLSGDRLSLHARMGAICDIYDAITSNRPYKAGWSPAVSLRRMAEWARSGHLDAQVFAAFVKCIGIYPLGSLVRLRSERLAVVIDNSGSLLAPVVRVFFSIRKDMHVAPETVDLMHNQSADGIANYEEPDTWNLGDLSHFWT
ncbi:phosphodiesterase [Duganella sp. Leaf126]|uniref:HD-GYP domain-containing protein n=1 Tax=Duganella sp. Leaf126 TaxID=1736266 RepID=UPI0006F42254|nr:HD-GYP domain-containing protein [Duganella sp. Leaf126]KQQ36266.1 phosphodiesterase [Duganella sp. Leaf126]